HPPPPAPDPCLAAAGFRKSCIETPIHHGTKAPCRRNPVSIPHHVGAKRLTAESRVRSHGSHPRHPNEQLHATNRPEQPGGKSGGSRCGRNAKPIFCSGESYIPLTLP